MVLTLAAVVLALAIVRRLGQAPARRSRPADDAGDRARRHRAGRWTRWLGGRAHAERADDGLASLLDELASGLRGGLPLTTALLESIDPSRSPRWLAEVVAEVRRGGRLAAALDHVQPTEVADGQALVATALAMSARTGRADPLVIETAAEALRARRALAREIRVQAAPALASTVVLTAMPPVFLAVAVSVDPPVATVLASPTGLACAVAGLALDAVGGWWMARLIREVRP